MMRRQLEADANRPGRNRIWLGVVLVATLALSACSGSGGTKEDASAKSTSSTAPHSSSSDDNTAQGDDAPEKTPSGNDAASGSGAARGTSGEADGEIDDNRLDPLQTDGKEPASPNKTPVSAKLGSECVRPGGTQSITITSNPNTAVGYQSVYSDGKKGGSTGAFGGDHEGEGSYGGNNGGLTDEGGTWKDRWTVDPAAPPGPVKVTAFALGFDSDPGETVVSFEVANIAGDCS